MDLNMNSRDTSRPRNGRLVNKSGHAFSIELNSKEYLKLITIPNGVDDTVSIEGFLGELKAVSLVEGVMLEIQGTFGSLKMDLKEDELKRLCVCHQKLWSLPIKKMCLDDKK